MSAGGDRPDPMPQLLNRLRMRQVALLLAIDQRRTLRAAAADMGLTQPAATKMLRELEDALGQPLFDRVGRGLVLNAAGERVTDYCRSIRGSVEAMSRELGELRLGGAGRFAVGSIMAASPGRLTDALLGLKQAYPLLAISITVDTSDRLLALLHDGELEVVVGRLAGQGTQDCEFRPLEEEPLAIVVARDHPLARRRRLDFASLLEYPWVLPPPGSPMRDAVEREFRSQRCALPAGLIETGSFLTTINMVRQSRLVAVVPETLARSDGQRSVLSIVPVRLRQKLEAYGSLWRKDRPLSPHAQRFLALLHPESA